MADAPVAEQLTLPGIDPPVERKSRRRSLQRPQPSMATPPDDPLLSAFLRRLAAQGAAREGLAAYRRQMTSTVRIASRLKGRTVTTAELFLNEQLLGSSVVDDTAQGRGVPLSKWTLAQRRSAIRKFVTLMRPEF